MKEYRLVKPRDGEHFYDRKYDILVEMAAPSLAAFLRGAEMELWLRNSTVTCAECKVQAFENGEWKWVI